jgi:metal-dependent amidase/aminoacylase/carboxypeptidase family protein
MLGQQQRVQDHHPRQGRHAALPHLGIDPVPVACQMVQAFQTIVTRNKRPIDTAVISVTMIHAGEATNVVPDSCEIQGTVRTFSFEVLDLIERRMKRGGRAHLRAFGAQCEFEFHRNYPPTSTTPAETDFVRQVPARWPAPTTCCPSSPRWGPRTSATSCRPSPAATSPSATATAATAKAATA